MRYIRQFILAGVLLTGAFGTLNAQERSADRRDPAIAVGFAWLCPGCGHLYTGETTKGALIGAISVGALATGFVMQMNQSHDFTCELGNITSQCRAPRTDLTPMLVGGAIGLAGYLYGLIDARASAERMNERNGLEIGGVDVKPAVGVSAASGRTMLLGVTLSR